ncbi:MAG: DedA family protein [Patescibacteria group bacterium]
MLEYYELLQQLFLAYGLLIIFPLLLLENFPFIGFFTPALTVLFLAGFFLGTDVDAVAEVLVVAFLAVVIGDNLWYGLGRWSGGRWRWLRQVADRAPNVEYVLTRQHPFVLIFYQFVPYLRMFLPYALGVYRYTFWRWLGINLVGSLLYVGTFILLGVAGAQLFTRLSESLILTQYLNFVLLGGMALYTLYVLVLYRKGKRLLATEYPDDAHVRDPDLIP